MTNPLKQAYKETVSLIKCIPFITQEQRNQKTAREKELYKDLKGICGISMQEKAQAYNNQNTLG
ncbi:MAG TPA: hypothetical protein VGF14_00330 [Alphaproteobacteria bacterium]